MEQESQQQTIEVTLNGDVRLVMGVTKATTCNDVIESIMTDSGENECLMHSYAVFESSRGIERQLLNKTKVLKVIRAWGSDTKGFKLVLHQVDSGAKATQFSIFKEKFQKLRRKYTARKSDEKLQRAGELADMVRSQRSRLEKVLNRNRNHSNDVKDFTKNISVNQTTDSMAQFMTKVDPENMADFLNFCCVVSNNEKRRLSDENIDIDDSFQKKDSSITRKLNEACHMDQREGKREILKRFLSSQKPFHVSKKKPSTPHGVRSRGDGSESDACVVHRIADGASIVDDCQDNARAICTADTESNSDYGSADLDEAFVEQFENVLDLSDVSDDASDCDDDMNVCQLEDDIVDVIMNTSICMSESDEGWSSAGSDE